MGLALLGGLSGMLNARSANKPKTSQERSSSTRTPYRPDLLDQHIPSILDMFQQAATSPRSTSARTGEAQGGNGFMREPGPRGRLVPDPGVPAGMERRPDGRLVPLSGAPGGGRTATGAPRFGGGGGGGGTLGGAGGPDAAAQAILQRAADAGLNLGGTDLGRLGSSYINDMLTNTGASGFGGRNPAADALFRASQGASLDSARNYLQEFLGGGAASGGSGFGHTGGGAVVYRPPGSQSGSGGGGGLPAMTPRQTSRENLFDAQLGSLFDTGAADEQIREVIDNLGSDLGRNLMRSIADIQARGAGAGRATSDIGLETDLAREGMMRSLASQSGQLRLEDLFNRRSNILGGLGLLNTRNIAGEGANVNRANALTAADASRANAASAAGASALASRLAAETARRGQDLQAAQSLAGLEQFGLGNLGSLAGLRQDEIGLGLGGLQGLQGLTLGGINAATGAGSGMGSLAGLDTQQRIAAMNNQLARYGIDTSNSQFQQGFGQSQLNDYLRALAAIGGMGGAIDTTGSFTQPGANINPWAALINGGLGGFMTGAGMASMFGG